jgi:hypothetical protein
MVVCLSGPGCDYSWSGPLGLIAPLADDGNEDSQNSHPCGHSQPLVEIIPRPSKRFTICFVSQHCHHPLFIFRLLAGSPALYFEEPAFYS